MMEGFIMRINNISNYGIYPAFCANKSIKSNTETVRSNYALPDYETSRAYASNVTETKSSNESLVPSVTVNDLTLCSSKNKDNYGSYIISLENLKEIDPKDKAAFELYKCCKYMTMKILKDDLKESKEGAALAHISNKASTMAFVGAKPENMSLRTTLFNCLALDLITLEDEEVFENAKDFVKDYYKANWDKMKSSKKEKFFTHNELKNEATLEDVEKKIDSVTFDDYMQFKDKFKNKRNTNIMMILGLPESTNKAEKDLLEKNVTGNVIVNGKYEKVEDTNADK